MWVRNFFIGKQHLRWFRVPLLKNACLSGSVWRKSNYKIINGNLQNAECCRNLSNCTARMTGNKYREICFLKTMLKIENTAIPSNAENSGIAILIHNWRRGHGSLNRISSSLKWFCNQRGRGNGLIFPGTYQEEQKMHLKTDFLFLLITIRKSTNKKMRLSW